MVVLRWMAGTPTAALITALLFFFMASMIRQPLGDLPPSKPVIVLKITPDIVKPPLPDPKPTNMIDEVQPPIEIEHALPGDKPLVTTQEPDYTPVADSFDGGAALAPAPLIRVSPAYPERCRARGAEGMVLVQFDVAADGSVVNARIIQSSDSCFDRTVLNTLSGWKYPPAMQNGQAAPRYGLVERFSFQMTED